MDEQQTDPAVQHEEAAKAGSDVVDPAAWMKPNITPNPDSLGEAGAPAVEGYVPDEATQQLAAAAAREEQAKPSTGESPSSGDPTEGQTVQLDVAESKDTAGDEDLEPQQEPEPGANQKIDPDGMLELFKAGQTVGNPFEHVNYPDPIRAEALAQSVKLHSANSKPGVAGGVGILKHARIFDAYLRTGAMPGKDAE